MGGVMGRYIVRRPYQSHVGQYAPGQVLELDAEFAAWLLRDLPGVIEAVVPPAPVVEAPPVVTEQPVRVVETAPVDRMVKRASKRKVTHD